MESLAYRVWKLILAIYQKLKLPTSGPKVCIGGDKSHRRFWQSSLSKETLNKSFDRLRTNGKLLIPFVVSLSNHERNQLIQSFPKITVYVGSPVKECTVSLPRVAKMRELQRQAGGAKGLMRPCEWRIH